MKAFFVWIIFLSYVLFSSAIHDEIIKGNLENVKKIVNSSQGLLESIDNSKLPGGYPIHFAAYYNKKEILEFFISLNQNLNTKGIEGNTPLFWAMDRCNESIIKLLVNKGANLNFRNDYNSHVLLYIGKETSVQIVRFLIENGADFNVSGYSGTPLRIAIIAKNHKVAEYLKSIGAINSLDFYDLLKAGNLNEVKKYLKIAPGLIDQIFSDSGRTPIHFSTEWGFTDIVRYLLNLGDNPNKLTKKLVTPIHLAAIIGKLDIVKLLLNAGSKIIMNEDGYSPLSFTMQKVREKRLSEVIWSYIPDEVDKKIYFEIADILIKKGADVNSRDREGKTNLYYAILSGEEEPEMVKLLLDNGASKINVDGDGSSALDIAIKEKKTKIVNLLK